MLSGNTANGLFVLRTSFGQKKKNWFNLILQFFYKYWNFISIFCTQKLTLQN